MNRMILISLTLVIASLACLGTAPDADPTPAPTWTNFVKVEEPDAGEEFYIPAMVMTLPVDRCAEVIASEALHLRAAADQRAIVLTWLERGDVVRVTDDTDPDWWGVEFEDLHGYARSIYLEESECDHGFE